MSDHTTAGDFVGGIAVRGEAITKSDSDEFAACQIWVGTAGNVKVKTSEGSEVTLNSVPAGTKLPLMVVKVFSTGTSANNFVRLY